MIPTIRLSLEFLSVSNIPAIISVVEMLDGLWSWVSRLMMHNKKQKRHAHYQMSSLVQNLDEQQLMDTPVMLVDELQQRALVAGPQQPPIDK